MWLVMPKWVRMNGKSETVTITETYVRIKDKTYMESSLQPGEWREVPVFWLDYDKDNPAKWMVQERLVTKEEHRLLTA